MDISSPHTNSGRVTRFARYRCRVELESAENEAGVQGGGLHITLLSNVEPFADLKTFSYQIGYQT